MLEKIKNALRIKHSLLDDDIKDSISEARAEMLRSGVSKEVAESDHVLVKAAIKTYCLASFSSDSDMAEGYQKSWQYQLDNLRKSTRVIETQEEEGAVDA